MVSKMYQSNNKPDSESLLKNSVQQKLEYHHSVRVLFHENKLVSPQNLKKARVKFISRHKSCSGLEAILSLSIHHPSSALPFAKDVAQIDFNNKKALQKIGLTASIESIHLLDPSDKVDSLDENSVHSMISSILMAAYEYCDKRNVNEWQLNVAPFFKLQLNKFGINYKQYGKEANGKHHIGVDPFQFIHSGKPVIKLWNRRLFDFTLH